MRKKVFINYDMPTSFGENAKLKDKEESSLSCMLRERYEVVISDTPDYVFADAYPSSMQREYDDDNVIYVQIIGEAVAPNFTLFDYAVGFDALAFGDRYIQAAHLLYSLDRLKEKAAESDTQSAKRGFCSFIVSNADAQDRIRFYHALSAYKSVASGGRYLNTIGRPVADKLMFLKQYKFNIAFENCLYPGYTTEKIYDAFTAGSIPIYWGNPDISDYGVNPEAFINCHDYDSFDQVVAKVREIDENPELYMRMHSAAPVHATIEQQHIEKLKHFLFSIFDQPKEQARRRSNGVAYKYYLWHSQTKAMAQALHAARDDAWYKFGRYSKKRKAFVIIKTVAHKLRLSWLLKPFAAAGRKTYNWLTAWKKRK